MAALARHSRTRFIEDETDRLAALHGAPAQSMRPFVEETVDTLVTAGVTDRIDVREALDACLAVGWTDKAAREAGPVHAILSGPGSGPEKATSLINAAALHQPEAAADPITQ